MLKHVLVVAAVVAVAVSGCDSGGVSPSSRVQAIYSWPYAYDSTHAWYSEIDARIAETYYVKRGGRWYFGFSEDGLLIVIGRVSVQRRPDKSAVDVLTAIKESALPRLEEFFVDTTRPGPGRHSIHYPKDLDPVKALKLLHSTDLFLVGSLSVLVPLHVGD